MTIHNYAVSIEQPDLFDDNLKACAAEFMSGEQSCASVENLYEYSLGVYETVIQAQMNESLSKSDLEQYIKKILDAVRETEMRMTQNKAREKSKADVQIAARSAAENAAFDRGDPLVRKVCDAAYKVSCETHRLMGLLRFNPNKDNIWIARCEPDHFILPFFAEHFTMRFGDEPWAIIDERRGLALVRLKQGLHSSPEECALGPLSSFPFLLDAHSDTQIEQQDNWENLWRSYHKTIVIENRMNPALQRQFMPTRYWKYLPEKFS